jgi:hypothetical protein
VAAIAKNVAVPAQVIDVLHPNRASVPKEELKEKLAKTYKVQIVSELGSFLRACRQSSNVVA